MRILFLHEVNYLTKPIFEMHEFPEHLARLGHEVGFVHFPEGYSQSQIRALGRRKRIPGRIVNGVQLELFTPCTPGGSLLGRLFTAKFSYWQFRRILRDFKPEVVVSFSVPTSGWQALIASKRAKVPFVFRALDVSHKIRKGVFSDLVKASERFIYKEADGLSANNPAMLAYCRGLSGRTLLSEVHSPPLDLELFATGDRSKGRAALGISESERVILYLGSFFYFSGLPEVLKALSKSEHNVLLVLIGGGEQDSELRSMAKSLNLENQVIFTGMVPFESLPELVAAADVAINPMEKTLVSNAALPNKVLQYMAAGVPVVSTSLDGLVATFGVNSGITWGHTPFEVAQSAISIAAAPDSSALVGEQSKSIATLHAKSDPSIFEAFLTRLVISR